MAANSDFINFNIADRIYDAADPRLIGRVDRVPAHTLRRAAYVRMWRAIEQRRNNLMRLVGLVIANGRPSRAVL